MDKKALEALAKEAAKSLKTEHDLSDFKQMLTKLTVEAALNGEMEAHLGYSKYAQSDIENSRNGVSKKKLQTEEGLLELDVPRDRDSSFAPQLVKKHQRRLPSMSAKS